MLYLYLVLVAAGNKLEIQDKLKKIKKVLEYITETGSIKHVTQDLLSTS